MSHALLTGTVEKLEGKDDARKCAAAMASNILTKKAWVNHRRCEVEPDLDSPALYLFGIVLQGPHPHRVGQELGHSNNCQLGWWTGHTGLGAVLLPPWCGEPANNESSKAYPRERLNHWQRYCEEIGEPCRGLNQRMLAARLCYRLTQEGAWEKCVKEGLSRQTLEEHLKLRPVPPEDGASRSVAIVSGRPPGSFFVRLFCAW